MGIVEGQMGFVALSYAAAALGIGGLTLWVALGHRARRREIERLERELER